MRLSKDELVELWDVHCKGKYPREFGGASGENKTKFTRNIRISDSEVLYKFVSTWDYEDTYVSVYSFREWHEESEVRKATARIDTLFIDIDCEDDVKVAFLEAKKLVKYLMDKGTVPRVYFSGAKGFHVYIDFPETDLFFRQETLRKVAAYLAGKLKLRHVDFNVIELARISRIPLTVNRKTGYRCVPINPHKFVELDFYSVLHFCKNGYAMIEINESENFASLVRRMDLIEILRSATGEAKRSQKATTLTAGEFKKNWRKERIEYYAKVLRERGYLSEDPKIVQIHMKNPRASSGNPGSIEHLARVHLVLLMIEEGYTDEQIHDVFRYAKDYDPKKTQYYIDYNRKWIEKKRKICEEAERVMA